MDEKNECTQRDPVSLLAAAHLFLEKVKASNDQENAQSERNFHSKKRGGKN